ncbi:MAG: hypothetical protein AAGG44_12710, partial [Planctomycetota bacterium]
METIRANFQSSYLMRYAIMAAICIGAGLWFAYDGFIGYPSNLPAARAYDEIRDVADAESRIAQWNELAQENGWSKRPPEKKAEEIESDIVGQYFWMAVCFLGGIPAVFYYLKSRGTWVESTEAGLKSSWGQEVSFDGVIQLDKKRWEKKGIAKASYMDGDVGRTFVFDDFKYEREPLGKILTQLEESLER